MEMAGQVALRFPVVGWLLRDAIYGRPEAKYYFLANCVLAAALGAVSVRLRLRHLAGACRRLGRAGAAGLYDRRRQLLARPTAARSPPTKGAARRCEGASVLFAFRLVGGGFAAGDDIDAAQPAVEVDVGATLRAERIVALVARLAADRADLALARGRRFRFRALIFSVCAIAQAPGAQ